jgi:hypothetical protein
LIPKGKGSPSPPVIARGVKNAHQHQGLNLFRVRYLEMLYLLSAININKLSARFARLSK